MYAALNRKDIKALNRLDKRRRMKYDARHKETASAEELRAEREEVEATEGRHARELTWPHHGHSASHR